MDVFAKFYDKRNNDYTSMTTTHDHKDSRNQPQNTMTPFTMQDLDDPINHSRKSTPPEESNKTVTTIVQQSHQTKRLNSSKLAGHDDQSCIQERGPGITIHLPTHLFDVHVHILFSQLLFKRLPSTLDANQSAEQLRERPAEWNQPLWVAAIVFLMAFDTVRTSRPTTSKSSTPPTSKTKNAASREERNWETRSARSCSTHAYNTS